MRFGFKFLTVGTAAFFFSSLSFAEERGAKSGSAFQIEEIVVTGTRVETKIQDVSQTIDVISKEDVETVKYRNAGELLRRIPGVFTQNLNGED